MALLVYPLGHVRPSRGAVKPPEIIFGIAMRRQHDQFGTGTGNRGNRLQHVSDGRGTVAQTAHPRHA